MQVDVSGGRKQELVILLIGKTGSGKSATGNSILDSVEFVSRGGGASITKRQCHGVITLQDGCRVTVVDTPGLGDTDLKTKRDKRNIVVDGMVEALINFPMGFHAVVIVISYEERMGDDGREALKMLVNLFDTGAFSRYGVLVLSHGDSYNRDYPERNGKLDEWVQNMKHCYREISNLCDNRWVLFDNVTQDVGEKSCQRSTLLAVLKNLDHNTSLYIPTICQIPVDQRGRFARHKQILSKYVNAKRAIFNVIEEIEKTVFDETTFTDAAVTQLKKEATCLDEIGKEYLRSDRSALNSISTKIQSLNHTDELPNVQAAAKEILEMIKPIISKIDHKIKTTELWRLIREQIVDRLFPKNACTTL